MISFLEELLFVHNFGLMPFNGRFFEETRKVLSKAFQIEFHATQGIFSKKHPFETFRGYKLNWLPLHQNFL